MGIINRLDSGYCGLHHHWVFLQNHKSITSEKFYQKYELDLLNPRKKTQRENRGAKKRRNVTQNGSSVDQSGSAGTGDVQEQRVALSDTRTT